MCRKAFKAFLVYKTLPIAKLHDLIALVRLCKKHDNDFSTILDLALSLDGLDVEFRYPIDDGSGVYEKPEALQVKDSIDNAKQILDFVKSKCI